MDTGTSTRYNRLFQSIESRKRELGEEAVRFPVSKKEYLEKPIDERMEVAMRILESYAEIGEFSPGSTDALIKPSDKPDIILMGRVGFIPEDTSNPGYRDRRDFEAINVSVGAKELSTGITTTKGQRVRLGQIRQGSYTDDAGETQQGWHVLLNAEKGTTLPLSSQLGEQMVEFVDVGVSGLIEDVISTHRKFLGSQALAGAAQA